MRYSSLTLFTTLGILSFTTSQAAEPFKPERISVEKNISPGPNVFVLDQNWKGASTITVLSADDLSTKGNISDGLISQFTLSQDKKHLYTASVYPKRIMSGPTEAVVQDFDIATLSQIKEMETLPKMAQVAPSINSFQLSAEDKYAFVQNATPAASVSVISLATGQHLLEVPTPGCWGIYASQQPGKFSSLCGDGTIASYQIAADEKNYQASKSEKLFDSDKDALFLAAQRDGDTLMFTSFTGNMVVVSDKAAKATLVEKFNYTDGVEGHWVPGGFQILAYNKPNNLMFVTMHPDGKEGSHKDAAKEVWGIDMAGHKVVTRFKVDNPVAVTVSATEQPQLFTLKDNEEGEGGTVTKYSFSNDKKFTAQQQGSVKGLGDFNLLLRVDN